MRYCTLPGTDIRVSRVAMGCWALAGDGTWGEQSEADSVAAVRAALDAGITFFDTAPGYGGGISERRLGLGLKGRRDEAVVATKVSPDALAAKALEVSVERSLTDLAMDHVDLLQIHWPNADVPLEETWGAFERLRRQGKVRALGVSNFGVRDFADLLAVGKPTTNQLPYSLLSRAVELELVPASLEAGVGILCYSPLCWGLLTGKYPSADAVPDGRARSRHFSSRRAQTRHGEAGCERETFAAIEAVRLAADALGVGMADLAVAWLLHRPAVTAVLTGIRNPAQARDNARAADLLLEPADVAELDRVTLGVKAALGSNLDLWQGSADSRYR